MWPVVRARIAKYNAATDEARGESNWIKRREDELAEREAANKLLIAALHERDETITELRLKVILLDERDKRRRSYVGRLEAMLLKLRPDAIDWMNSDNGPLGPPEIN